MRGEFLTLSNQNAKVKNVYKHIIPVPCKMGSQILDPRVPSHGVLGSHFRLCYSKGVSQEYFLVAAAFIIKRVTSA